MKKYAILCLILALLLALPACASADAVGGPSVPAAPSGSEPPEPEPESESEPEHEHQPAEEDNSADGPEVLYCGNTVTTISVDGEEYSFEGDDSVALTDLLLRLAYVEGEICRCQPEYGVETELFDGVYGVSLTGAYARNGVGQAELTEEQVELIRGIIERHCA